MTQDYILAQINTHSNSLLLYCALLRVRPYTNILFVHTFFDLLSLCCFVQCGFVCIFREYSNDILILFILRIWPLESVWYSFVLSAHVHIADIIIIIVMVDRYRFMSLGENQPYFMQIICIYNNVLWRIDRRWWMNWKCLSFVEDIYLQKSWIKLQNLMWFKRRDWNRRSCDAGLPAYSSISLIRFSIPFLFGKFVFVRSNFFLHI